MVAVEDADEEEEEMMVDWLLRHQCGLCEGVMDICVETLCCQSTACKQCADKYIKSNR